MLSTPLPPGSSIPSIALPVPLSSLSLPAFGMLRERLSAFFLGSRAVGTTSRPGNKYSACVLAGAGETRAFACLPCSVLPRPQLPLHHLAFPFFFFF